MQNLLPSYGNQFSFEYTPALYALLLPCAKDGAGNPLPQPIP